MAAAPAPAKSIDAGIVSRWTKHLLALLDSIPASAERPIRDLPQLPEQRERTTIAVVGASEGVRRAIEFWLRVFGVDATTEARIREGLREVMRGRTTIIIAHRLSTIQLADEVVVLEHGRVTARGTQEELLEDNDVYRELHEHGLLEGLLEERIA